MSSISFWESNERVAHQLRDPGVILAPEDEYRGDWSVLYRPETIVTGGSHHRLAHHHPVLVSEGNLLVLGACVMEPFTGVIIADPDVGGVVWVADAGGRTHVFPAHASVGTSGHLTAWTHERLHEALEPKSGVRLFMYRGGWVAYFIRRGESHSSWVAVSQLPMHVRDDLVLPNGTLVPSFDGLVFLDPSPLDPSQMPKLWVAERGGQTLVLTL